MRSLVLLTALLLGGCERTADTGALSPYLDRTSVAGAVPSVMGPQIDRALVIRDSTGCWPGSPEAFGFDHPGVRVTGYSVRGDSLTVRYAVDTLETDRAVAVWDAEHRLVRVAGGEGSVTAHPVGRAGPIVTTRERGGRFYLSNGESTDFGDDEVVLTPRGHWMGGESDAVPSVEC